MTSSSLKNWSRPEYAQEYRDHSNFYIPERETLARVLGSYARAFLGSLPRPRVLDLGCGDGAVSETLHRALPAAEIVAADGSADMIAAARTRLAGLPVEFRVMSFEEIIDSGLSGPRFDGIFSALAIHHLPLTGKAALFRALRLLLGPGGHFLNVDVITSETPDYTDWHFALWREWIVENQRALHLEQSYDGVPDGARTKEENHFDPLPAQLAALREADFSDVECHYRYGLFAIYGGRVKNGL
ncbi:MAG: class I SAM-dependent methyltransferase [Anaerolineales bacterium]|jgi:tRNA (cmo5U34)-methyltransferase